MTCLHNNKQCHSQRPFQYSLQNQQTNKRNSFFLLDLLDAPSVSGKRLDVDIVFGI